MKPVLYIIMRNDLASMNPGKGMAQAAHAANAFVKKVNDDYRRGVIGLYESWRQEAEGQGFGTTIVLGAPFDELIKAVSSASLRVDVLAGLVLDPTYPVTDGEVVHQVSIHTCGYVFCRDDDKEIELDQLELHP